MSEQVGLRGKAWFQAFTGKNSPMAGDPGSVLTADAKLGEDTARFLCVVPNPGSTLSMRAARRSRTRRVLHAGDAYTRSGRAGQERG